MLSCGSLKCALKSPTWTVTRRSSPNSVAKTHNKLKKPSTTAGSFTAQFARQTSRITGSRRLYTTGRRTDDVVGQEMSKLSAQVDALMADSEKMGDPLHEFSVDRTKLNPFGLGKERSLSWQELEAKKGKRNELTRHLMDIIQTRGPMSISTFMNYALTFPTYGYYMKSDVFGKAGDFTTSPEISQMFGELLGTWCVAMWQHLGRPAKLHIVELGPGRGTLSSDLLNASKNFKDFFRAAHLHLVEVSPHLRRVQAQKFGLVYPAPIDADKVASIQVPKGLHEQLAQMEQVPSDGGENTVAFKVNRPASTSSGGMDALPDVTLQSLPGTLISWHQRIEDVPVVDGEPMLVIAQEFFDALPVYQLEMTSKGWRERLVDLDDAPTGSDWFRTTLAPSPTPACVLADQAHSSSSSNGSTTTATTPHKEGTGIEVCAEGMRISQLIADRLLQVGGAAVFIDYGHDTPRGYTIRGIKDHQFVSIYQTPGEVDLSANVDFAALTRAALQPLPGRPDATTLKNLRVYGSVNQGDFLASLGIYSRMAKLLRKASQESDAEALIAAFDRLTDRKQMGSTYKVLGMFSHPKLVPEGFEGAPESSMSELFPASKSS